MASLTTDDPEAVCIWKVCPDGGFYARKSEDPAQAILITPEPNLAPLRAWVLTQLAHGPQRWQDLLAAVRDELWRGPHLNQVIRELRKTGAIRADDYKGMFAPKNDPRLSRVG